MVIMNHKLQEVLNDSAFNKIKKDTTAKTERTLAKLIKATDWPDDMKFMFTPRMDGLPNAETQRWYDRLTHI